MIPTKKIVMVPGPVPVSPSILQALGSETRAHTDPVFVADFQALLGDLRDMLHCDGIAFLVAGSGTMGMEMAVVNIASQKDRILLCSNGHFGDRYESICERRGYRMDVVKAEWGKSVTVEEVDAQLAKGGYSILIMTHVETSTGAMIQLKEIAEMVKKKYPEVLFLVDGVAAAGGAEADMRWGIDLYLTCTQKALGSVPGMMVLWANKRALEKRESMGQIPESYVDFARWIPVMVDTKQYWGTPAVNNIMALKEAMHIIKEEGYEARCKRHAEDAAMLAEAMEAIGFKVACEKPFRASTLSVFLYPQDMPVDDAAFRAAVAEEGGLIAGCLGAFAGKGFRMGHMANLDKHMLVAMAAAVERGALRCGMKVEPGAALAVVQKKLALRA
ncbi:aminotransferase class V-fold PLP-dependent enzyme [Synergistaceae bacterium OttesenSCG-928-D05]|nr:aminotransferase class V-fold PLP-dependent enzyme [Synergistaceae bacterium OttesenSCG-928-D05]